MLTYVHQHRRKSISGKRYDVIFVTRFAQLIADSIGYAPLHKGRVKGHQAVATQQQTRALMLARSGVARMTPLCS